MSADGRASSARVLFCGSRSWSDVDAISDQLRMLPAGTIVMQGGARGADQDAARLARERGFDTETFFPDWGQYGNQAGIVRNLRMLNKKPVLVVAFWDGESRGTKHTIDEARRRGINTVVVTPAPASAQSADAPLPEGEEEA